MSSLRTSTLAGVGGGVDPPLFAAGAEVVAPWVRLQQGDELLRRLGRERMADDEYARCVGRAAHGRKSLNASYGMLEFSAGPIECVELVASRIVGRPVAPWRRGPRRSSRRRPACCRRRPAGRAQHSASAPGAADDVMMSVALTRRTGFDGHDWARERCGHRRGSRPPAQWSLRGSWLIDVGQRWATVGPHGPETTKPACGGLR
jgi:hypothetical protein